MSEFESQSTGIDFNFDNPIELDIELEKEENTDLFTLNPQVEEPEEVIEEVVETEEPTETEEPVVQTEQPLEVKTEEPIEQGTQDLEGLEEIAPVLASILHQKGHITELPEGVDAENFGAEDFWKTVEHNINKTAENKFVEGIQYEQKRLVEKLPNLAQDVLAYSLGDNLDDEDVFSYMQSLVQSKELTSLNPETPGDAERIVTEYYKQAGWKPEEISTKVNDLIQREALQGEAVFLKPKLDEQATRIAQEKVQQQRQLEEYDKKMQKDLETRVSSLLSTGKINEVPLTREEVSFLYNAAVNNEIPVRVKGGKQVEMGFAEYLVRKHKYSQEGNLQNMLLGLLVMEHGTEAIEKFVAKKARTKEVNEYTRQMKFSGKKKGGRTTTKSSPKNTGGFIFKQ